ncbi:type II toxin-antitoxin system RelE/ParE family toxin [Luteolibacter ambystomatis]|uniref:Type II toxin-antitoxin system RelE/ParE family toxin n=1 Tax=Luteolibacter ambystomatis TaxID=2824561 RepID=A0A975G7Y5_9BACT|nr:type II toxin-antitoxin system RelE/ParE family toxin [Luteolibacter ambystomatis]QUE50613.1 type II toxin-antitoxin system RelE/ParE family toxin [Luteolibacter ambystomatis]
MAEVIWTEPALADLDAIAEYIALDKLDAARRFVKRVFKRVEQLASFPEAGSFIPEMRPLKVHRQVVVAPCRIFYRFDTSADIVRIVGVMRGERLFRPENLDRD